MAKICVVGVGALGTHLVQFLRNHGDFVVVDMDRVENKNVSSQFHLRPNVGKGKAQSFVQSMQHFFGLKMLAVPHKLTKDNDTQLLGKSDLILDCLDNLEARTIVQAYARKHNIPCLHGALAPNGEFGRVVWDENFVIDSEAGMGAATCEDGEHLPFIALVSAYLSQSAKVFLKTGKRTGWEVSPMGVMRT